MFANNAALTFTMHEEDHSSSFTIQNYVKYFYDGL